MGLMLVAGTLFFSSRAPIAADLDSNPPGYLGGFGTNWENRPGPRGGPGSSPDYRIRRDWDNNPLGLRGGRGPNL